jgi:hypothetical protein
MGYLTVRGQGYFLSELFGSRRVGVRESDDGRNVFWVFYWQFCVAKLDVDERVVIARKPFIPSVTSGKKL